MDLGIWPPYEAFYIEAMLFNGVSALRSCEEIANALQKYDQEGFNEEQLLDNLQNLVMHGAALSRYFWPARKGSHGEHEQRAQHLGERFEMTDDSPLKDRDLRNQIEHFDEKLDSYLLGNVTGHIIPKYVGPLPEDQEVPVHIFRAYYTDVGVFEMLGRRYEVQPIADEIYRVYQLLEKFVKSGYRMHTEGKDA